MQLSTVMLDTMLAKEEEKSTDKLSRLRKRSRISSIKGTIVKTDFKAAENCRKISVQFRSLWLIISTIK